MEHGNFKCGPQVGPREAGESHPSATAEGSPSYSGGGKNCSVGQRAAGLRKHDHGIPTLDSDDASDLAIDDQAVEEGALDARSEAHDPGENKWKTERLSELRVVLTRCSDSDGSMLSQSPSTDTSPTREQRRKRRVDDVSPTQGEPSLRRDNQAKRGRGKTATKGQYMGLAHSRRLLNAAITREQQLDAEEEADQMASALRQAREERRRTVNPSLPPVTDVEALSAAALTKQALDSLAAIQDVARKSKNLKGGFVRVLKESGETLRCALGELGTRTASEEVARLQRANERLSKELEELRQEVAQMRQGPLAAKTPLPEEAVRRLLEENSRTSIEQFGTMLNARLEAIECRLLPAPTQRPPLASGKTEAVAAPTSRGRAPLSAPQEGLRKAKKKRKKKASMAAREAALSSASVRAAAAPPNATVSWSRVAQKGAEPKGPEKAPAKSRRRKPRPPRAPRSAAVTLTLQPAAVESGETYAKVIAEAMGRINPSSLGLVSGNIRFRATQTEARMFQVFGAESSTKADSLAEKLREVLSPDVVRISRPNKCCDIRLTGLDDSATAETAAEAVAREGGCDIRAIRAGSVGPGGSVCLSCPVAAARKVAQVGRVRVGWVSARVTLLGPRPLRCFRCLELGHVGAVCKAGVDRSGLCYHCGETGHKARGCAAEARCAICAAAGRPAAHALGGKGCPTPGAKKAPRKDPRAPKPTRPPQEETDVT